MYTPLKVTTDYSILKSLIKVKDLVDFCVKKSFTACAICDSNLFGVIEFYKACKANKIKPIIGLEVNIDNSIIYLYARNYSGYLNLLKINTYICEHPLNLEYLKKYSSDILVIIPYKACKVYEELDFIKDRFIGYENKTELKNSLIISNKVIYVNDIKVFKKDDLKYLTYLNKISETENDYDHNYFDYDNLDEFDLKNIAAFVDLIDIEMPLNKRYIPKYCEDSYKVLSNLCLKGLAKRLNNQVNKEYLDRLKYELSVIQKMGFVDYFLIVYDYVLYAKKNSILVGPGRGSAAGSLVSYVIGITDIDPIKYHLLFERFLNYERVTMPDIDIDFDNTKRDLVTAYVKNKYGNLNVSGGMTFTTFKTRLVLRDVGKILKIDDRLLNKFIKIVNKDISLKDNLKIKIVNDYLSNYKELKNVYEISLKLEGLKKNISTHAAGIVIGDRCLDEIIPMYKNKDVYLTGVEMSYLEDLGLLKMDFLALKNLSTISNIINKIPNFNLHKIPLDDKEVYKLFSEAETDGIFQFETPSFKRVLTKYKPKNFAELIALIALNRPGPSKELETYIKRKEGREKVTYYHESLKDILNETYGVIIYQEQVISTLVRMAKFSYAEADNIRRAVSKKKEDIILKEKDSFIKRSIQNGYSESLAKEIFDHILQFASYGFNKAHSVSYAYISYQMAYLKAHYNSLFTFELLNNSLGNTELIKNYINELKKHKLLIKEVNINYSINNFVLKNNLVFLPFKLIKNLSSDVINKLLDEREKNGLYVDIFDFFRRTVDFISKNEYIMLINALALKDFSYNVFTLITNLDSLIDYGNLSKEVGEFALKPELRIMKEYDIKTLRVNEINSYGFYITNHPASKYLDKDIFKIKSINEYLFKNIKCYVLVESIKNIKTKKNEDMAFLRASDDTGICDFTVFPKNYYLLQNIQKNDMIKVWGSVTKRFDKVSIIINNIAKE